MIETRKRTWILVFSLSALVVATAFFRFTDRAESGNTESSAGASEPSLSLEDPLVVSQAPITANSKRVNASRGQQGSGSEHSPESFAQSESTRPVPDSKDESPPRTKAQDKLEMPDWARIFNPGGAFKDELNETGAHVGNGIPDYKDLYRGLYANFIEDNFSNGIATDMSALLSASAISDEVIYNGAVSPAHDLGNAYFLAKLGPDSSLQLFLGVERLSAPMDSYVEIELNQLPVTLGGGTRWWEISGARQDGDLLVRVNLSGGRISLVELDRWMGDSFMYLDSFRGTPGEGCLGNERFTYCGGKPPIEPDLSQIELWDAQFMPVAPIKAEKFIQIGMDLLKLTGANIDVRGVLIRTPEDIAINGFREPLSVAWYERNTGDFALRNRQM